MRHILNIYRELESYNCFSHCEIKLITKHVPAKNFTLEKPNVSQKFDGRNSTFSRKSLE